MSQCHIIWCFNQATRQSEEYTFNGSDRKVHLRWTNWCDKHYVQMIKPAPSPSVKKGKK